MDFAIAERTAAVLVPAGPLRTACARALEAEGVVVAGDPASADIVVAAAPPSPGSQLLDVADAAALHATWDAVVDTVEAYRHAVPAMAGRGWGRIVWIGSAASRSLDADDDELGVLVTLAMRAANKVIAAEAGPANVTANAVLHGGTATAADVAAAVVFLCSAGAGYITGVTITVDGGTGSAVY